MNEESVDKYFKLSANININNFVLFDSEGKLKRYNGTSHVMSDFYEIRIKHYRLRLDYLISKAKHDLDLAANKARFLEELLS
jgi:DNA topoisomerase-2